MLITSRALLGSSLVSSSRLGALSQEPLHRAAAGKYRVVVCASNIPYGPQPFALAALAVGDLRPVPPSDDIDSVCKYPLGE